jgi:hypothetical protein
VARTVGNYGMSRLRKARIMIFRRTIKITNRRSTAAIPSKAIPAISCIALSDIMESPTLTLEEIKGNLCYYDAENPNNNLDCYDDEEERPKPRENCHCDNCFYGRDKLARYILSNQQSTGTR